GGPAAQGAPHLGGGLPAMPGVAGGVSTGPRETEKREYGTASEANI
ncbi:unnamed protein product, partial [Ectocarpus sp. 4 AP-2014]